MKSHPNYGEALTGSALQRAAMALVLLLAAALPAPRAMAQNLVVGLLSADLPGPLRPRAGPTVAFGLSNLEAIATMELTEFRVFATPVPEPETYAMLLAGLGLLGFAARRRKLKEAAAA